MMNPFKTKKGLGRGLSSLIGDVDSKPLKNKLSISSIVRNKFQPRKNFDKEKMEELTNSIRERGILQPIIVRKSSDQSDKFEIIAGERRWQAAQSAGLHEVPVVEVHMYTPGSAGRYLTGGEIDKEEFNRNKNLLIGKINKI